MKRNNKKGFTIVELVIVIAVIAILSAVLIPTFGGVIDQAHNSADQQNARNEYTEYLAAYDIKTNGVPAIDYVLVNGKYFAVNNNYALSTTLADCAVVLSADASGNWAHATVHTGANVANGVCDACK